MAVYRHKYQAYSGPLTSRWSRIAVFARYGFTGIWSSRITAVLVVVGCVPALVSMCAVYLVNNPSARMIVGAINAAKITIDERFFVAPFQIQCWLALALAAWITPRLVSPELADNALPTILSRPITRAEYVLGKFIVVAATLSLTTWMPGLLLFGFQSYSSPQPWAARYSYIAWAILAGSLIWIVFLSFVVLALSVWVKWRIVATGLIFAAIFVPAGIGAMANNLLRTDWGSLISVPEMMPILWERLFRVHSPWLDLHPLPTASILISLALIMTGSVAALNARIRAREVVRG